MSGSAVISVERWHENWRVVSPPGAVSVKLARRPAACAAAAEALLDLPSGTPVVLSAPGPWASRRCRDVAAKASVELERGYLAFPSAVAPAFLVEDAREAIRVFVKRILIAPPGARSSLLAQAAVSLVRTLNPWRLMRLLAPGWVAVGRRT